MSETIEVRPDAVRDVATALRGVARAVADVGGTPGGPLPPPLDGAIAALFQGETRVREQLARVVTTTAGEIDALHERARRADA